MARGDYSREPICLSISLKGAGGGGGDYLREAINRGTAIIRVNTATPSRPSIVNNITTL